MNTIIKRTLSNGSQLEIRHIGGVLLKAYVNGNEAASGGLADLRKPIEGYAKLACGKVPVTEQEASLLGEALAAGRAEIQAKQKRAKKYNDLMNEGGEGYTPLNMKF